MQTEVDRANALIDQAAQDKKPTRSKRKPPKEPTQNAVYPFSSIEAVSRYAVLYGTDDIWDIALHISMKPNALRLAIGRDSFKEWESNPLKLVVQPSQLVFDPTKSCPPHFINMFAGLPLEPKKGDCADLLALLMHLMSGVSKDPEKLAEAVKFVLSWLAYPLQNPGAKMATALLFHGPQGTGKNLFFEAYARIFGEYGCVIGQAQIESKYNSYMSRKLLIIGDEIVASHELTHFKNALKGYVTGTSIQIEAKFQSTREERNHANFVFMSNDTRPLALEKDDRRHMVVYCPAKRTDDLYTRVRQSIDNGAVEALYEFLMSYDLSDFHSHSLPPVTVAKADLVELGLKPAERFTREWLANDLDLPINPCSTGQLFRAFLRYARMTGERSPPNQAAFTATVSKFAGERITRIKTSPSRPLQEGTSISLWVPEGTGSPPGVTQYNWAVECVAVFESPLARFGANQGGDLPS